MTTPPPSDTDHSPPPPHKKRRICCVAFMLLARHNNRTGKYEQYSLTMNESNQQSFHKKILNLSPFQVFKAHVY